MKQLLLLPEAPGYKMDCTKNIITFSFALFLHKILFPVVASLECSPPFVPMNGSHTNVKQKYTPGEKIEYSCDKGYYRVGQKQSSCRTNGSWRGHMPFCDPLHELLNSCLQGHHRSDAQRVMDKNTTTCLQTKPGDTLLITLKDQVILQAVKLFLKKGPYDLRISTDIKKREKALSGISGAVWSWISRLFQTYIKVGKETLSKETGNLTKDDWISIECKKKILTDSVLIQQMQYSTKICELEVYGSKEISCNIPPPQLHVPNGHFIIDREKAMLKCSGSEGKIYIHSTCDDNQWNQMGISINCEGHSDDSPKNLAPVIVASAVTLCFVLGCLIVVLVCLYKKRRGPFVVVTHPEERHCCRGHAPSAAEEEEGKYETINYNEIPLTSAETRTIPKNFPANLPDLLGYTEPQDEDNFNSSQTKVYIEPQDALPIGNAQHFMSLKKSSFYGD